MLSKLEINLAYGRWAERLVAQGWSPYLLTFMFHQLGGSPAGIAQQMEREVERIYATLLPRVVRKPTAPSSFGKHPVWFCCHDRPVHKHEKQSLCDVAVNDGQHVHAAAFQPPWSRLREELGTHFEAERGLYIRPRLPLLRIHVQPITRRVRYAVDYVRKHTGRSLNGEDASFVLPRSLDEVRERAA